MIILGNFFYKLVSKRNFLYGPPLVQKGEKIDQSLTKEQPTITVRTLCTNCGFKSEEESLNFCPECGNKLVS